MTTTAAYHGGLALSVNGALTYELSDGLGSVSAAVNTSESVTVSQLYDPYGNVRYESGTLPMSKGYTGQQADTLTGLDYCGARYYDPVAGQFTSANSVLPGGGFNPGGLSRYAYVADNPETHVDADGHCWPLCTIIIGAVVGAAMGAGMDIATAVVTHKAIDWGQVGKDAAVGAVSGPISGLVEPEAGPLVRAVDTDAATSIGLGMLAEAASLGFVHFVCAFAWLR